MITSAVVSVPPDTFALILTEPSALYSTVVLFPATIFALYLTIVFPGTVCPTLFFEAGVFTTVAVVP